MERLMILLAVVAVSLWTVLSCPPDQAALTKEFTMCLDAIAPAGKTREGQCLFVTALLTCVNTTLTGCEGVPYAEAYRAVIDPSVQGYNTWFMANCD